MRKVLLSFSILLFLFGCQENQDFDPVFPDDSIVELQDVQGQRAILAGDPNLNANFDWETNHWAVYYDINNGVQSAQPVNPFHDDGIFGYATDADRDYKASQGWMLVARDFGTPTSAPTNPWIMLYNKYRGLLRLCVYRIIPASTNHQSTVVTLDNTTTLPDVFEFVGSNSQTAITQKGHRGWMVSEFNFQGYDASIAQQARLQIDVHEVSSYDIFLNGGIELEGQAQPKPKFINGVHEVSNYSSKIWESIGILGKDDFKATVASVAKNAFSISSAAAGIIKGLTGSGSASTYNINLEGDVSLSGTMTQTHPPVEFTVYLRHDASRGAQPRALQNIPWGVMNYTDEVELTQDTWVDPFGGGGFDDVYDRVRTSPGFFNNILVTNPAISGSITNIEAGWVIPNQNSVLFMSLNTFKSAGYSHQVSLMGSEQLKVPEAVGVRLTFSNGDMVYNRIPTRIVFGF